MIALAEALRQNNLKVTPQRLAIYELLSKTKEHPSAESIYNELKPTYPSMSLATVYKTLDALKKANLVQSINVGEDSFRFDACVAPHPHFLCKDCGQVFDIEVDHEIQKEISALKKRLSTHTGFSIGSEKLYFYGQCSQCKEQNS